MKWFPERLGAFARDESGTSAIEYGLIAAAISVAIVTIVLQLGNTVAGDYQATADGLANL